MRHAISDYLEYLHDADDDYLRPAMEDAIADLKDLSAELALHREHWEAMMAYQYSRSDADMWKYEKAKLALMKGIGYDPYAVKMAAVRKMRGEV